MKPKTRLSVNINKIATLRNARDENVPDVERVAVDIERFGAEGITVHPRPDERHIRRSDVFALRPRLRTEFNIEGYPSDEFIGLVLSVKPEQVTLVPDAPDALTSSTGWNVKANFDFLSEVVSRFKEAGIRTSIFVDPDGDTITRGSPHRRPTAWSSTPSRLPTFSPPTPKPPWPLTPRHRKPPIRQG